MNILPIEKQVQAIAALTEGCSIRAVQRLTGIHRDTIMRLGVRVGEGCAKLHDGMMRDLNVPILELDEIWSYVGKKQKNVKLGETDKGDWYTFIGLDATNKAIVSYLTGKRSAGATQAFVADLRERVVNRPQITSDGFSPYVDAVELAFGADADFAQLIKHYAKVSGNEASRRYSPGHVVAVESQVVAGEPDKRRISTSFVERQNLTLRMQQRRFTRLTNGFSKKLENHKAAVGLYVAHYNLCRVHEAHRITPAMALGVTDHIWSIGELVESALSGEIQEPVGRKVGGFRVIDGGLNEGG